jgi:hypothetical protein
MHRRARGLVHHDERLVLEGNIEIPCRNSGLRTALGGADGRYAQPVARLESVLGLTRPLFTRTSPLRRMR